MLHAERWITQILPSIPWYRGQIQHGSGCGSSSISARIYHVNDYDQTSNTLVVQAQPTLLLIDWWHMDSHHKEQDIYKALIWHLQWLTARIMQPSQTSGGNKFEIRAMVVGTRMKAVEAVGFITFETTHQCHLVLSSNSLSRFWVIIEVNGTSSISLLLPHCCTN